VLTSRQRLKESRWGEEEEMERKLSKKGEDKRRLVYEVKSAFGFK